MLGRNGRPRYETGVAEKIEIKRLQVDVQVVKNFFNFILAKIFALENFVSI